jgi:hypothetical protein
MDGKLFIFVEKIRYADYTRESKRGHGEDDAGDESGWSLCG